MFSHSHHNPHIRRLNYHSHQWQLLKQKKSTLPLSNVVFASIEKISTHSLTFTSMLITHENICKSPHFTFTLQLDSSVHKYVHSLLLQTHAHIKSESLFTGWFIKRLLVQRNVFNRIQYVLPKHTHAWLLWFGRAWVKRFWYNVATAIWQRYIRIVISQTIRKIDASKG